MCDIRAARASALAIAILLAVGLAARPAAAQEKLAAEPSPAAKQGSGLPVPRFVSLKADEVNLRAGPGKDYPTSWVYRRAGLPLEVIREFDVWREVRDAEGTQGWIIQSLLSGRRTALVQPWDAKKGEGPVQVELRKSDSESARVVAVVEAGVIANVIACDATWCRVTVDRYRGYIQQKKLWGVYEGEILK